jgi:1-deoxy-D-xylulose-5-phosphate synthase
VELPIGRGEIVRAGEDVALVGYGTAVAWCRGAAELLAERGIHPTVVNARFAKPLDEELLLQIAGSHRHVVTVEEHALHGGFGAAVLEMLEQHRVRSAGIHRLGVPDRFIEQAARGRQLERLGLSPTGIARVVGRLLDAEPRIVHSDREVSRHA